MCGFWGAFPSFPERRLVARSVFVECHFITRLGFPLLSPHVLRVGAAGDGGACFSRDFPRVAESASVREDDLASPSNIKGNPFSIFPLPVRSSRRNDIPTRCCDPCFRSPNELLKATFSGALAILWKTSCFRRWAFIMWVSCASVGIYR